MRNDKVKYVWDEVYRRTETAKLPWQGISFTMHIGEYLYRLNPIDKILLPGCGVGDTVNELAMRGYGNITGTDISSVAIQKAKMRFPHLDFECIPTENLGQKRKFQDANVIDWLNLHQVSPTNLRGYLSSLALISKSLLLVYFYDPKRPQQQKSVITGERVYNHNPKFVSYLLRHMKKMEEKVFYTEVNKEFDCSEKRWRTVSSVYEI